MSKIPKQRSRRWPRFRFRLRTFVLIVTLLAVWLSIHLQRAHRQKLAVEKFREYGGWVAYDYQIEDSTTNPERQSWVPEWLRQTVGIDFFHNVAHVNLVYWDASGDRLDNRNSEPAPLQYLKDTPWVTRVLLKETQATDDNLQHLRHLRDLESLYIWDASQVTDAGVEHLRSLKSLQSIHLSNSRITDQSMDVFAELPKLQELTLQGNQLSDQGIRKLAVLEDLESLWVCGVGRHQNHRNKITDDGIGFVMRLPKLKRLGVQQTLVSKEFLQQFSQQHPGCKVYF